MNACVTVDAIPRSNRCHFVASKKWPRKGRGWVKRNIGIGCNDTGSSGVSCNNSARGKRQSVVSVVSIAMSLYTLQSFISNSLIHRYCG